MQLTQDELFLIFYNISILRMYKYLVHKYVVRMQEQIFIVVYLSLRDEIQVKIRCNMKIMHWINPHFHLRAGGIKL